MDIVEIVLPLCPSDNNRLIPVFMGGHSQMVPTKELKEYKKLALPLLTHQWNKNTIIIPSVNHQLHIQIKVYLPNWRSDSSNYTKALKDLFKGIVYDDDKFVHADYLDTEKDVENPRMVIRIPLDSFSIGQPQHILEEDRYDKTCTCTRQKLLELGWHAWETTHSSLCPSYKALITKRGRTLTLVGKTVAPRKNAGRRRKTVL